MKPSDIVLVHYPFTDFSDEKLRPALVLLPEDEEGDYLLTFITSISIPRSQFDYPLLAGKEIGLKKNSLVRLKKIMTIHKSLISGRIGTIDPHDWKSIKFKLKIMLNLE